MERRVEQLLPLRLISKSWAPETSYRYCLLCGARGLKIPEEVTHRYFNKRRKKHDWFCRESSEDRPLEIVFIKSGSQITALLSQTTSRAV